MSSDDRYCLACGERFRWFEERCDRCGAALVDRRPGDEPAPDAALVPVFESCELGAIDLARVALEQEGIDYVAREPPESIRRPADDQLGRWMNVRRGPVALVVLERDADRARALLSDLQQQTALMPAGPAVAAAAGVNRPAGIATILLHDAEQGTFVGRISEGQLELLRDHLEKESEDDRAYYIDAAAIDMLAEAGADESLVNLLTAALAGREGLEIQWSEAP